jgi:hypothetical protein
MARGWESKSIESQQDEAQRSQAPRPRLSQEQREIAERRRTLTMSRCRAVADLGRATAAPHRKMLEQAIAALDEQIAQLPG